MRNLSADILANNMNRRAMAKEIGISPTTLCKVASGSMPDMITLQKIVAWLGMKVEDYVGFPTAEKTSLARSCDTLDIVATNEKWLRSGIQSIGHE